MHPPHENGSALGDHREHALQAPSSLQSTQKLYSVRRELLLRCAKQKGEELIPRLSIMC